MTKAKKSSTQTKAPPRTDAEALSEIVVWSADRPAWQRQALRLLVQHASLKAEHLEELYALSKTGSDAPAPIDETDVRSPKSSTSIVTLKAVMNPEDVNALAADQSLSFMQTGLTIVYGDNGAGKSGYARILKQACRARLGAKPDPIISNIYEQAPGVPRAKIAYTTNGQNRQFDWRSDASSPAELSAISVFDSRTANVHVDGTNEVAYTPYALELMQRLAQVAEALRDRCKREQIEIAKETPEALRLPPIDRGTAVAKALADINEASDIKTFERLALLTNDEQIELDGLRQDLGSDSAKAARHMTDSSAGLLRFGEVVRRLCDLAGNSSLNGLRTLKAQMDATRQAADAAARMSFAEEPLPQVGSDAWRSLWEAARGYAIVARPDRPFPPEDGPCPLCQQELNKESLDRLARFDAFVKDDTKTRADAAEKAYGAQLELLRKEVMPASQIATRLRFVAINLADDKAARAARIIIKAVWQLRRIVRSHADVCLVVDDLDCTEAIAELKRLANQLNARAAALSAGDSSPERKALVARKTELEARAWLRGMVPDIGKEIARKKSLKVLTRIETETDTRAITQKASQLAEALVTDALRAQFTKEIGALGVSELAVELKKESAQSG